MTRLLTLVTYLLAAIFAYRRGFQAGYLAHRVDAIQPFWHISKERVRETLRALDGMQR